LRDGEDGYFVECGDIKGLVQKLRIVLGSLAKAEKLGKVGQQRYQNLFKPAQTAYALSDTYKKLLSQKTQRKLSRELTANSKIE
jgi:glycosyltransferase involved in cell wall biosynthesis